MYGFYDRLREVEKAKPFAERAMMCVAQLSALCHARAVLLQREHTDPVQEAMRAAVVLLEEAIKRGVKGKEPV
jgi:hypothetical protein